MQSAFNVEGLSLIDNGEQCFKCVDPCGEVSKLCRSGYSSVVL